MYIEILYHYQSALIDIGLRMNFLSYLSTYSNTYRFKVQFHHDGKNEWNLFRARADGQLDWQHFSDHHTGHYRGMNNYCCGGEANREDTGDESLEIIVLIKHIPFGLIRCTIMPCCLCSVHSLKDCDVLYADNFRHLCMY